MSFESVISVINERFQQVRDFLSLIKQREEEEKQSTSSDTKMLRGLFFVHLYSAFEFSINHSTQHTLQLAGQKNVKLSELEPRFYSVSLNHFFQAYRTVKLDNQWKKRIEIFDSLSAEEACQINNTLFSEYLQNIWTNTLVDVCNCLCLPETIHPNGRERHYIDELVDRRNAVAHGRECAHDVGERTNASELETRLNTIKEISDRFIAAQENLISRTEFIRPSLRANYQIN